MSEYLLYDVAVSVLTPLHIGSGRELLHEYDYAIHSGRTWRIDERELLEAQSVDDPRLAEQLARTKPAELLTPADFRDDSPFFRYVLRGTPRSTAEGAQVREQLKDPFDRPYLPGSSLKGALRTALAWHGWAATGLQADARDLDRRRQWAGQRLERTLFGRNPNHDLLRALHVADSEPVDAGELLIANVRVHHRSGKMASPIELEALRGDTQLQATLKLDLALFSDWARRRGLQLNGGAWLQQLPAIAQAHARDRVQRELVWFGEIANGGRVHNFYRQLAGLQLGRTRFLLQVGWGTGWEDKTFGSRLQADERLMERVIGDYRLARGRRQAGDPFPRSRRLAVSFARNRQGEIVETPVLPLGWCLVEMKERGT